MADEATTQQTAQQTAQQADQSAPPTPPPSAPDTPPATPAEAHPETDKQAPAPTQDVDKLFASIARRKAKIREEKASVEREKQALAAEKQAVETARAEAKRAAELQAALNAGDFDKIEELLGADAYDRWTQRRLTGTPSPKRAPGEKSEVEQLREEIARREQQREFDAAFSQFVGVAKDEARFPDLADMSEQQLREEVPFAARTLADQFGRPPTYEEIATAMQKVQERRLAKPRERWGKTLEQQLRDKLKAELRAEIEAELRAKGAPTSTLTNRTGDSDGQRAEMPDDPDARRALVVKGLAEFVEAQGIVKRR